MWDGKSKLDMSVTPLRVVVVILGLFLVFLNDILGWNVPYVIFFFTLVVMLTVVLTQPKNK